MCSRVLADHGGGSPRTGGRARHLRHGTWFRIACRCGYRGFAEEILEDGYRCPKCKSTLVAATYMSNDQLLSTVKKKRKNVKLNTEESHLWQQAWLSASLVQNKGKEAVIVLSGRGVGPATATRILRRVHRTEQDLYVDILKAEREYARTRLFWD